MSIPRCSQACGSGRKGNRGNLLRRLPTRFLLLTNGTSVLQGFLHLPSFYLGISQHPRQISWRRVTSRTMELWELRFPTWSTFEVSHLCNPHPQLFWSPQLVQVDQHQVGLFLAPQPQKVGLRKEVELLQDVASPRTPCRSRSGCREPHKKDGAVHSILVHRAGIKRERQHLAMLWHIWTG